MRFILRRFTFLPDRDQLSKLWLALVEALGVTGFRAHDVRLVAAMQSYGITQLPLTPGPLTPVSDLAVPKCAH